ncbi:MAG: hypothetical protein O7F71_01985 [Gammaproteobacteria bacterium]|nr:hypothetical protein [Gammaproteobacteria bacterium]
MLRSIGGYLGAVVTAYILAAIASTQSVLAELTDMGVNIDVSTRFATIGHDLIGLLAIYLPIIAIAFIIAWPVTALIVKWLPRMRTIGYVLAGFAAIVGAHLVLKQLVDITGIAAARTTFGLIVQGLAGAAGGLIFVRLVPSRD